MYVHGWKCRRARDDVHDNSRVLEISRTDE